MDLQPVYPLTVDVEDLPTNALPRAPGRIGEVLREDDLILPQRIQER